MKKTDKFILCYVTDRISLPAPKGQDRESALVRSIENAVRAGVDWVQIREKDLPGRNLVDLTRMAIQVCKSDSTQSATRILVNDRFDVAWAAGAAGVHAGENSLSVRALVEIRRASLPANFLVGFSSHSIADAMNAAEAGADYLFFGPIFETPSKTGFGPPQGLPKLEQVCDAVSIPVIAIGGIAVENARVCRDSGAAGIAAIRLFQQTCDIAEIVAGLTAN